MLLTSYVMFLGTIGLLITMTAYGLMADDMGTLALCAVATGLVCFAVAGVIPDKIAVGAVITPALVQLAKMGGFHPGVRKA